MVERREGAPPRAKQSPAGALFALLTMSTEPPCSSPPGRWNIKKQLLHLQPERGALVERKGGSPPRAKQSPAGALFALLTMSTEPPCSSPTGHWNIKNSCCICNSCFWWGAQWDSNPRSPDPQSGALTDYAMGTISMRPKGLEPPAHCLEGSCSIHLSYGRTLLSHWVPLWRLRCEAHAARSIIPYPTGSVKDKMQNSFIFFAKGLTAATYRPDPMQNQG